MEPDARDDDRSAATEPAADRGQPAADPGPPAANPGQPAARELRAAAAELASLADRPLEEHVGVYERLHAQMQTALRSVAE